MTAFGEISCAEKLEVTALSGVPIVSQGTDLAAIVREALARSGLTLLGGDVLVVASKLVSRAEGRFVDLGGVVPSPRALALSTVTGLEPRLVELVLSESAELSRAAPGVLICRNRLGVVCANAGVDLSNARPSNAKEGSGPWALRLPESPDASAERLHTALAATSSAAFGVVISDSVGRPFRLGSIGAAIGLSGLPALFDQRGRVDLFGYRLEHTMTALADQVAGVADLVLGQASEQRGVALVRGLRFPVRAGSARELVRPPEQDLYAAPSADGGDA